MSEQNEIEVLRTEVGELRASLLRLEQRAAAELAPTESTEQAAPIGRRQWMKTAAGAAVGGAAALVAAPAGRAAAANGDPLEIGNLAGSGVPQVATGVTQINYTGSEDVAFVVQSGTDFTGESSSIDAVIGGWTNRSVNPVGVYGFASASVRENSRGVVGRTQSTNGIGVLGIGAASGCDGVSGRTTSSLASGVRGEGRTAMTAIGTLVGLSADGGPSGTGVIARGQDGLDGAGTRYGLTATGDVAPIHVPPSATTAAPDKTDTHAAGEISVNETSGVGTGEMWLCVEAGDPGVWRRVAGPSTAGSFVPLVPGRAYDSRQPQPQQGQMANPASRIVSVLDRRDADGVIIPGGLVPLGATAISYNVTITSTVGRGFVSVEPGTSLESVASAINWTQTGQTIANAGIVKLAADGTIKIFSAGAGGSTDVIVDVTGFWR